MRPRGAAELEPRCDIGTVALALPVVGELAQVSLHAIAELIAARLRWGVGVPHEWAFRGL